MILFIVYLYPIESEIKDTTDTAKSASDLHLEIESDDLLRTKASDKGDGFNFPIVNFPFSCGNIPAVHVYGVYISVDAIYLSLWFPS